MSPIRHADRRAALGVARGAAATLGVGLCTACEAPMSIFDAAGDGAGRIARLGWFMVVFASVVYVVVMAAMFMAIRRNRRGGSLEPDLTSRSSTAVVIGGGLIPAAIFSIVFVASLGAMARFPGRAADIPTFQVVGHQWWWDVEYLDRRLEGRFHTANEIHIPVGTPVRLRLIAGDVIHSFWVPRLQGKLDLTPGDTTEIQLLARTPGRYRGTCAEYCGLQHAHMAFTVVAESPDLFKAWIANQQRPAAAANDSLAEGAAAFASGPCALCHSVRGTDAHGQIAPDLTHVGSRLTLAAGTLPNQLGTMEAWITDAQGVKPGARMPSITAFNGRTLRAVATYLESLK